MDKDEATQRAERDKEAAAKRMQNILPAWHLKSTISGDLTALGIKENARAEEDAKDNTERLPSSNDAILRGLGKPDEQPMRLVTEEAKPDVSQDREADCKRTALTSNTDASLFTPLSQIMTSITHHWPILQVRQVK